MTQPYIPVLTQQYLSHLQKWLTCINRQENLTIIFFPKTDRLRRIQQMITDSNDRKENNVKNQFLFTNFASYSIDDPNEVLCFIAQQLNLNLTEKENHTYNEWADIFKKNNIQLVCIIPEAEKYLNQEGRTLYENITYARQTLKNPPLFISLYETDITNPIHNGDLPLATELFQNIDYYPLYSTEDTEIFIKYLSKRWEYSVSDKIIQDIVHSCGGHFWLIKEAARISSQNKKQSFQKSDTFLFRLRTIFETLNKYEQSTLVNYAFKKKQTNNEETYTEEYFRRMNIISQNGNISSQALEMYIRTHKLIGSTIVKNKDRLEVNSIPLYKLLTKKEYRIVKYLLENQSKTISREELSSVIWPVNTQEYYSDWALDQIIARLRKHLIDLNMAPSFIKTVRGKGFTVSI